MISITLWRAVIGSFYNSSNKQLKIRKSFSKLNTSNRLISFFFFALVEIMLEFYDLNVMFFCRSIKYLVLKYLVSCFICCVRAKVFRLYKPILNEFFFSYQIYMFLITILLSWDIELNPGPPTNIGQNLSVFHYNVNSLSVHNLSKISLIKAFNAIHHFDIIFISETFLDSSFSSDLRELTIENYTMVRNDHPNNVKRGGVCVYYKSCLPICILNTSILNECVALSIEHDKKEIIFLSVYRSPSQSPDEFNKFLQNFENIIQNFYSKQPFLITILGDFNAKSSNWYTGDRTTQEGFQIDSLTSFYGLTQLIKEPTHITNTSTSCIDLIFTSQPNLVTHSGVYSSLYGSCKHQIVFAKFNLHVLYPPPYKRVVWHYDRADCNSIQRSISNFNWENVFRNLEIDGKIQIFNNTILNIFSNFCPSKTITCDDKDPPWITEQIKRFIIQKDNAYKKYARNGRNAHDLQHFNILVDQLNENIEQSKQKYYQNLSTKLNNPSTNRKKYWLIIKTLFNGKKVPLIPPLLVNDNFVTNFKEKANIFNKFFADQCIPVSTSSEIPNDVRLTTDKNLHNINFDVHDILNIIKSLDVNKAHGYDNISIRMIKICGEAICRPLNMIFNECLRLGSFPDIWKKGNIIPVHKKNEKNLVKNYRPISLLPVCSKIFERLIFNSIYNYITINKLLSPLQSGFKPGDSCTNQLLSITHNIYSSFDHYNSLEVRGVFLDMSKAFDKVWHEGLIYKMKCFGISGNLLNLLSSFLHNRKQRVILNGQISEWEYVKAGVPQGSILGPLLFLLYVNDLPNNLKSNVKLFADDVSLFSVVHDPVQSAEEINSDLRSINNWATNWKMSFNPDPLKQATEVLFSNKRLDIIHPDIYFNGVKVKRLSSQKHLGMILDEHLNFNEHMSIKLSNARKGVGILRKLYNLIPRSSLLTIYKSFIRPHLDYCDIIYDKPSNETFSKNIESIQYNAALAITGAIKGTSRVGLYQELGIESLSSRRQIRRLSTFYKLSNSMSPSYLYSLIPKANDYLRTRSHANIPYYFCRTLAFKNSFFPNAIEEWNKLDMNIRTSESYEVFKKSILKVLRPIPNSIFGINNSAGLKFLTRLRLSLSHLREHKFKHNFQDTLNPLCSCSLEVESTEHFLLHCHNFQLQRQSLLNNLNNIDNTIINLNDSDLTKLLLYGNSNLYNDRDNSAILQCCISFITSTKRFDDSLF